MGFATTNSGHVPNITRSADSRVVLSMNIGGETAVVVQTSYVSNEEWRGLSWADASALVVASESSSIGAQTRQYLGKVKLELGSGGTRIWNTVEQAFGTRIKTQCQKMNDTSLYQVVRTTEQLEVANYGGQMTKM